MVKALAIIGVLGIVSPVMGHEGARDCDAGAGGWTLCKCVETGGRDNYAGVRVYKNEHSSYTYHPAGQSRIEKTIDNFAFGTTMGNDLTNYLRVEYETLYTGAQYSRYNANFHYDIWANIFNVYGLYDIDHAFAPYIGAGLGISAIWGEIDGDLNNTVDLSYQALGGVLFHLNTRIDLDVGFKYINYGRVKHRGGITRVDATQLYVGATYRFGM